MFNAFKYTKQLEEAGFSREQAEIQLQIITEIVEGNLATKQDLEILGTGLRQDTKTLEVNLGQEMKTLEANLLNAIEVRTINLENKIVQSESRMQQLEYRLTIKLGTFLIVGFTAMATLLKFWLIR
jgi:hypothetical protein